jgi:hypothetical protein
MFIKKTMLFIIACGWLSVCYGQETVYVSIKGNDNNNGTLSHPFKTINKGLLKALAFNNKHVSIKIRKGVYQLDKTLEINSSRYNLRSLTLGPYANEKVIITGSKVINLDWKPYKNGIMRATLVTNTSPDQLYLNGRSLPMARYPNFDSTARVYNGTAEDAISEARVKTWGKPAGGYIHALHEGEWGDFHYYITGKDADGKLMYRGGWQNNRPAPMSKKYRYVENIFEELDAPGEWFYDKESKTIFLYPPKGTDFKRSLLTISTLTDLIHINGSIDKPVRNITISNITFTQSARSFMLVKEPLLRSDWRIYRGGAVLLNGTENATISACVFYELGGNAVFLSNYNKNDTIKDNHIFEIGANAIAFVGNPAAVRSPAFSYESFVPWDQMDYSTGPGNKNYPQYCVATDNLIHKTGTIEKQSAGIEISMSYHITASYNTIYTVPRAGINISEGTWGGHVIAFNDVFNTVLETGDHGAFNSWGRDRYWRPERNIIDSIVAARPGIQFLDAIDPIIICNNRFQCDHGWDIDLDDGSSNYRIYNNVCLSGGLKLREGYNRIVTNNILINNTLHPHVWLKNSGDIFERNIVTLPYAPILMNNWGTMVDSNFFITKEGLTSAQTLNLDKHSVSGDAGFINSLTGNYALMLNSPALKIGFKNISMIFGVTAGRLKKIAEQPVIKPLVPKLNSIKGVKVEWLGAQFKNIETLGEQSAAGMHNNKGALLIELPSSSSAAENGMEKGDVIIKLGNKEINSIADLMNAYQNIKWVGKSELTILRNQEERKIMVGFK